MNGWIDYCFNFAATMPGVSLLSVFFKIIFQKSDWRFLLYFYCQTIPGLNFSDPTISTTGGPNYKQLDPLKKKKTNSSKNRLSIPYFLKGLYWRSRLYGNARFWQTNLWITYWYCIVRRLFRFLFWCRS